MATKKLIEISDEKDRACRPQAGDVPKNPTRCVIHNHIKDEYPWARHVSVGLRTIRMYDYRCEHNPDGLVGKCKACPGVRMVWATPLSAAQAIKEFDAGGDPEFPRIVLRLSDAVIETANEGGRDRERKIEVNAEYRRQIRDGVRKPNKKSTRAKARAMSNRRKG